jgi:hypothetical protein
MSRRRRRCRLADLETRAAVPARDDAAELGERLRSLTDEELTSLIGFYDARPDLELMEPAHFVAAVGWPPEKAIAFFSRKTEQFQ